MTYSLNQFINVDFANINPPSDIIMKHVEPIMLVNCKSMNCVKKLYLFLLFQFILCTYM